VIIVRWGPLAAISSVFALFVGQKATLAPRPASVAKDLPRGTEIAGALQRAHRHVYQSVSSPGIARKNPLGSRLHGSQTAKSSKMDKLAANPNKLHLIDRQN
jgi:hypothetical protein